MKHLPVSAKLIGPTEELTTWRYCSPIFIANSFTGLFFEKQDRLQPKCLDTNATRNGTITFVEHGGEFFALTCKHVVSALVSATEAYKTRFPASIQDPSVNDHIQFFSPCGDHNYHFNYEFTPVSSNGREHSPDIAIARVSPNVFRRLGREAIHISIPNPKTPTGIASGYPEMQRTLRDENGLGEWSPRFVSCTATLSISGTAIRIQDDIEHHNEVDCLSGMSGGPIIWTDGETFGLCGIVSSGCDIQPKEGTLMQHCGILIHGELVSPSAFESWIAKIPPLMEKRDQTKRLFIPDALRKGRDWKAEP